MGETSPISSSEVERAASEIRRLNTIKTIGKAI